MICYLTGIVSGISDLCIKLDVNNVGFLIHTSNLTNSQIAVGKEITLLTELIIRENSWQIFGFLNNNEKEWFTLLLKVQGVGSKSALSILSNIPYESLGEIILSKRIDSLCNADGIGEKLASRIVNELHNKIPKTILGTDVKVPVMHDKKTMIQDVQAALEKLGFKPNEIRRVLSSIDINAHDNVEILLKFCLTHLRN